MYKYSIVIPFRDRIDLLHIAVNSIPDRSDIQIIIVDNGQVQTSLDKMPCKKNATICISTSSPIKGAGCARNKGLEQVQGKYLLFLDADDFFADNAFDIFDKASDSNYDIVFFKAKSEFLKDKTPSKRHEELCRIVDSFFKTQDHDVLKCKFPWPYCKLYKSSYVLNGGYKFQEVRCSNDVMFSIMSGCNAKEIRAFDEVVYVITEGDANTSLTKTKNAENQFLRFLIRIERNEYLRSRNKQKYQIRILPSILHSLSDFGIKEFYRYLKVVFNKRLNIFVGY